VAFQDDVVDVAAGQAAAHRQTCLSRTDDHHVVT
jgi:hypothetical protein